MYVLVFQEDFTTFSHEQDSSGVSEASSNKQCKKRYKKNVSHILSGAAKSMEKLAHVISVQTSRAETSAEADSDDWLFCKRMYLKLNKLPDNRQKDMFKVKMESELIGMTYGCSQHT